MKSEKPNFDYSELRGRVKTKIGNEGEFARRIGRSPQYVSQIFNGKKFFSVQDILKSCIVLEIDNEQIGFFFYSLSSQM